MAVVIAAIPIIKAGGKEYLMSENQHVGCPACGGEVIDTRAVVQPYDDFDSYAGFRCNCCKRTFSDGEVEALRQPSPTGPHV